MRAPIKIVDIEVSQPLKDIVDLAGYQYLRGLVRSHGFPIGYLDLPVTESTCHATTIAAAIQKTYGSLLSQPLMRSNPTDQLPLLTIAICTRDRPTDLARCLDAIAKLDYPALDLLVIDNAPQTAATAQLIHNRPGVRYICEDRPGLNWARNRAIAEAHGILIAFTDDDVIVDPGWARAIAAAFAVGPDMMAVTGAIVPYELETAAQLLFEQYGGFTPHFRRSFYRARLGGTNHAHVGQFGSGANMAFRLALFEQIGGFDPALDVGTATNGGGDLEIFFRLLQEGHTLLYDPAALVRHRHRRSYAALQRQIAGDGSGFTACLMRCLLAYPNEWFRIFSTLCWWLGWIFRRLIRPNGIPRTLILSELYGACTGPLRYLYAYQYAKRYQCDPAHSSKKVKIP